MREPVQVAAVQMSCGEDVRDNVEKACDQIQRCVREQDAQIVCLQELFTSRYFCQTEDHRCFELAESIPGPTSDRLAKYARELGVVIVAGLFEKRAAGVYHNSSVTIDADGRLVGVYRKMHVPDDPGFYEKFYFTPGDLGFQAVQTKFGKIGVCICWDQWFPEAARLTALRGAELIVYPTAIGWLPEDKEPYGESQLDAWLTMMRSHAIANGVFVAAPNRAGVENGIEFWGNSFVCDPYGNILERAGLDSPSSVVAECDFSTIDVARTHWPFLRDRRIDAYRGIECRMMDDHPKSPD